MKKRIFGRKLGSDSKHHRALLRNLTTSLIEHERIVTTVAKAKEMKKMAENLITMAKKPDRLHARREINKLVWTPEAQSKLMYVLAPRYEFRQGGYTRIMKLAKPRKGDASDMAVIEYVDRPGEIRAARPPTQFQNKTLADIMKELGIEDPNQQTDEEGTAVDGESAQMANQQGDGEDADGDSDASQLEGSSGEPKGDDSDDGQTAKEYGEKK